MSVLFRGILIILTLVIGIGGLLQLNHRRVSLLEQSSWFILFLAWSFPVIDLGFSPFGFSISPFVYICYTYLILCSTCWKEIPANIKTGILGFAIIYFLSAIFSDYPGNSIWSSIERLCPFAVFVAVWIIMSSQRFDIIRKSLIIIAVYVIIWGLIQQFYSRDFTFYYYNRISDIRIVSIFTEPQTAGCGIAMLALFFFNQYKGNNNRSDLLLFLILIFIGALTGSKTFLLGTLVGIGISLYFFGVSRKIIFSIVGLSVIIFFTQDLWLQLPVFERMKDLDSSYDIRSTVFWMSGWKIFEGNWITGIGVGNFTEYNANSFHLLYPDGELATQPESGYLLWLDETGLLTVYYLYVLLYILKKRGFKEFNIGFIFPWLIAFISVYNLESYHIQIVLYLFLSIILFVSKTKKHNENINSGEGIY